MATAAPGTIGLMGFTSQIVGISFPQKIDVAIIQAAVNRNGQAGDTLALGYGINPCVFTTSTMAGYLSRSNITQQVPLTTTSNGTNVTTAQTPINLLVGVPPLIQPTGFFGGGFKQHDLAWTIGAAAQVGFSPNGSVLDYAVRGYMFVNLTLLSQVVGNNTFSFDVTFGGSTYSQYALAVEVLAGVRGLRFGGNLLAFGGINLSTAAQMGWPAGNMTNWRKGVGVPSGSGTKSALNPIMAVNIGMTQGSYPISMSGVGFAANNVFGQNGGVGHE